jgi:hypothetical protein
VERLRVKLAAVFRFKQNQAGSIIRGLQDSPQTGYGQHFDREPIRQAAQFGLALDLDFDFTNSAPDAAWASAAHRGNPFLARVFVGLPPACPLTARASGAAVRLQKGLRGKTEAA